MNPIKLSEQLQETFTNYLTTTFDVNRDGKEPTLAAFIQESFNRPRALFAGPYLELTAPYQSSGTLQSLANENVISPKLLEMSCFQQGKPIPVDAPLYTHQDKSIRKLCDTDDPRNIVVSSGTGSGKTECFLIPILNDLLIDTTPGVRAVLVYPLNALVNDQLDRLRVLLRGTEITFGRYTSELEQKSSKARQQMEKEWQEMEPARHNLFTEYPLPNEIIGRDQIQEHGMLPQILITNYAMLEYLLLRPQDNPLFTKGKWRFIVLDEAHTYAGSQGIEVGLLVRRLKHRLGHKSGEMRCIATSATLTNDAKDDACAFAEALFGEPFTPDDIIFGEPNHNYIPPSDPHQPPIKAYTHERFDELLTNVRQETWESSDEMALLMQEIGLINEEQLSLADKNRPPQFLWEVLRGNEELTRLRNYMVEKGQPIEVTAVAETIFSDLPVEAQKNALYHLIELAAMAREDDDKPSLLPARYHLFVRPPQGIWACINPTCPDKHESEEWSKLFAAPRETCDACNSSVYPLVVCRSCGQVYVRLQQAGKKYLSEVSPELEPKKRYVTQRSIHENRAIADDTYEEDDDEELLIEQAGESTLKQSAFTLCIHCQEKVNKVGRCGCGTKSNQTVTLHLVEKHKPVKKGKRKGHRPNPVDHLKECVRCHSRALGNSEIATEVTMYALTPLAILTDDLYRTLPESTHKDVRKKAGGGRKLLSFYDSRQGAARFAAFVQSVVNQQAYRRVIMEAITASATKNFWPDMEKVSRDTLDLALIYRILHNDLTVNKGNLPRHSQYLSQSQEERLVTYLQTILFAEITTRLRSRQSLEALGLISVTYFEPDNLPDFNHLAQKIQFTNEETQIIVSYLLDELRRAKVVSLPSGVKRDDLIFGRNKFSPRLVLYDADKNEVTWIGKTTRHRRYQLMQKMLQAKGLAHDETAVKQTLTHILTWLTDKSGVLDTTRPADGYQIRHDRLFFHTENIQWYQCDQCQRLNNRGNKLPCPHAYCHGTLQPVLIDDLSGNNFYHDKLNQELVPMRIEEHTAQLAPEKGRTYQNEFKSGNINMLSCSTTFEMGIDLGDLQAVVMSNIPPTVANYKQRAGRAGRRTSGTAFILAWASNRPHDQTYFKSPPEIINGHVRVPYIDIQNHIIIRRHINALLLSKFLRHCAGTQGFNKRTGAFFDDQNPDGAYYDLLPEWLDAQQEQLLYSLSSFGVTINEAIEPVKSLHQFETDLRQNGFDHYQKVAGYYKQTRQELAKQQMDLILQGNSQADVAPVAKGIERYGRLLERLQKEGIINFLSDRGVLPSYSFPLHTVELSIPPHLLPHKNLRLQRNLQQAIREYAPGQEIVADKKIWKSAGLDYFGKEPKVFAYHICPECNHLRLEKISGKDLDNLRDVCPICKSPPKKGKWKQHQYIQPDGFRASYDSGKAAGQYINRPFNLMRSALVPGHVSTEQIGDVLSIGYDRSGTLLYVNEGLNGMGFRICPKCGKQLDSKGQCNGVLNGQPCSGKLVRGKAYTLGFQQDTDTLHLKFSSTPNIPLPDPDNEPFWFSLLYALLQGASRALQIERKDIDGVLFPESLSDGWRQTIVLYDNVPGGAGHVKRIQEEINEVVASALEIVNCDCEKSCYRCLREYSNQWKHQLLERIPVEKYLRSLDADLQNKRPEDIEQLLPVTAINQTAWLWKQIEQAKESVLLSVDKLSLVTLPMENRTWLDLLQELMQRNVNIRLYLNKLPDQTSGDGESITLATHLRLLMRKTGMDLRLINRQVPWTAVIDANTQNGSAIQTADRQLITLNNDISSSLLTTQHSTAVRIIQEEMGNYRGRAVEIEDLRSPANTTVIDIHPDGKQYNEADFFTDFYDKPVKSIIVSDRYLERRDTILDRLGSHIALAQEHCALEWVVIRTRKGQNEQKSAIQQLKSQFPDVRIKFQMDRHTTHDRFIEITRADESKARAIIGVGLDFIRENGEVRQTFLVFQDPFEVS